MSRILCMYFSALVVLSVIGQGGLKGEDADGAPAAGSNKQRHIRRAYAFKIHTEAWTLILWRNGAGQLTYGSNGVPVALFPVNTFDSDSLVDHLRQKLAAQRPDRSDVYSAWFPSDEGDGETLWEQEPGPISAVFEAFRCAYKDGKATDGFESSDMQLPALWRTHPPTKVSNAWDAKCQRDDAANISRITKSMQADAEQGESAPSETDSPWKSAGFRKRLSDGSTATLEFSKWAERTTRVLIAQDKESQDGRSYPSSTETLYLYRIVLERDGTKETVLEKMVTIGPATAGLCPDFSVKDVEIIGDRLYILYAFGDGYLNLVVLEKKDSGPWVYLVCWRLDDRPRWMDECRLANDAGRPCLRCLDTQTPAPEDRWYIHWNVDGTGALRKRE